MPILMTQIFSELLLESRCKDEVIQEFCPLAESLDWLLGQLFYRKRGSLAFRSSRSAVPYEVTSDGNLSASAAELLFSDLESQGDVPGQIIVLELGAGSGLFAKCFLDIFRDINRLRRKDYYDRLLYVVTDASASMLSDLDCCKMLHQHSEHVEIRQGDILSDGFGKSRMPLKGSVRAIFANYFLDSLPATVLRVHNEQLSELRVRTRLQRSRFRDAATLSIDQVSEISKSADPSRLECLLDRTSDFVLEYDYFKVSPSDIPFGEFVLRSCPKLANESGSLGQPSYIVHNYGAFECIRDRKSVV